MKLAFFADFRRILPGLVRTALVPIMCIDFLPYFMTSPDSLLKEKEGNGPAVTPIRLILDGERLYALVSGRSELFLAVTLSAALTPSFASHCYFSFWNSCSRDSNNKVLAENVRSFYGHVLDWLCFSAENALWPEINRVPYSSSGPRITPFPRDSLARIPLRCTNFFPAVADI